MKNAQIISTDSMTSQEAYALLLDAGYNNYDAYDILADNGFDPHPSCPSKIISGKQVLELLVAFYTAPMAA